MLPMPAITAWSSSSGLSLVRRPASSACSVERVDPVGQRIEAQAGQLGQLDVDVVGIEHDDLAERAGIDEPQLLGAGRRASVQRRRGCAAAGRADAAPAAAGRSSAGAPSACRRCRAGSSRYLPRRPAATIVAPVSPSTTCWADVRRTDRSRPISTRLDRAGRRRASARPRRTVSTSGSSGIGGSRGARVAAASRAAAHAAAAAACSAAFFDRPVALAEHVAADEHRGEEALGVVGPLGAGDVLGRAGAVAGGQLLQARLVVEVVEVGGGLGQAGPDQALDRRRRRRPARRRRTPRRAPPRGRRTGSTASPGRRRRPRRARAAGTTPRSSSSATSARASALTTPLRTPVSAPSGRSAKRRKARSATTQPRTASPRNSSRSLLIVPGVLGAPRAVGHRPRRAAPGRRTRSRSGALSASSVRRPPGSRFVRRSRRRRGPSSGRRGPRRRCGSRPCGR